GIRTHDSRTDSEWRISDAQLAQYFFLSDDSVSDTYSRKTNMKVSDSQLMNSSMRSMKNQRLSKSDFLLILLWILVNDSCTH
ncbi:hypothetical protein BaRGS_00031760, partial [Batillaria attramentaria]